MSVDLLDVELSSKDVLDFYKNICPDAVFIPTYPQTFGIDLIIDKNNYGYLEFVVKESWDIAQIKGDESALKKFEQLTKKIREEQQKRLPLSEFDIEIPYPVKNLRQAAKVLMSEERFKKNKDWEKMAKFIRGIYSPIDTELLYKKTGEIVIIE